MMTHFTEVPVNAQRTPPGTVLVERCCLDSVKVPCDWNMVEDVRR